MATKKNPAANPVVQSDVKGFSAKPQPTPEPTPEPTPAPTPAPLPSPLDPTIELKAKVAELQVKLTAQVATIDDLKTQLKQLPSLQAALTKSEAAARQLASWNATLQAENESLKATPAVVPPEPVKALATVEPSPLSNARPSLMMRSVFPNEALPGGIAEQEIGWFD